MATFFGIDLGLAPEAYDEPNEHRRQVNAYPGVNGLEMLDHGTAGGVVVVTSIVTAADFVTLKQVELTYYNWQATGVQGPLIDNYGVLYPLVFLNRLKRSSRILPGPQAGYMRRFQFEFLYLT